MFLDYGINIAIKFPDVSAVYDVNNFQENIFSLGEK